MKAAILQCDRVLERFRQRFGDYPDMIREMFADAGHGDIDFHVWDCEQQSYPEDASNYDFFITTGSKADAHGDEAWIRRLIDYTADLDRQGRKLIGICFGHQVMALALGGRVERSDKGWGVGIAHNRMVAQPGWMRQTSDHLDLIVSHRDQVTQLPGRGETVIAESDFCPFFMLQWNDHFLSVQGHPEWNRDYARALLEDRRGRIPDQVIEAGLAALNERAPDNRLFAGWIMDFVTR